ncbi:MAG: cell division protein FtsZ [Deltaproteobacteria bacterium]|nr:cell division protein FtsZ [Deltaproteobacteria bacterium]
MIELENANKISAKIKVVGIGGGGCNAINTMIESNLEGVEFIAANTDLQALGSCNSSTKVQLGAQLTGGLGAGADPEVGRNAMAEDVDKMKELLTDADMIFIAAGMGGGTGTGGSPVLAEVAKNIGALTVAVVTKPFLFEGKKRQRVADKGIEELKDAVDTLIAIPNQRLLVNSSKRMTLLDGFRKADEVLLHAVKGISDLITIPGLINLDFNDVRTVMSEMGMAFMGIGTATGENRAVEAAQKAISSPLLEDISIDGAKGLLINITAGPDLTLYEVSEAATMIQEDAHEDANIIFGSVIDDAAGEEVIVTVIATGFGKVEELLAKELKNNVSFISKRIQEDKDIPTFIRERRPEVQPVVKPEVIKVGTIIDSYFNESDEYDTPTFLRRQAE